MSRNNVLRRVEVAREETAQTGEIEIHFACGTLETFRTLCDVCKGPCVPLIPALDVDRQAPELVRVAAFSPNEVTVLFPVDSSVFAAS